MPDEERKIEPHYQAQAKQLVDSLYDLGLLSESLSRDGITSIDDLVALYFQQTADSAAKCASFSKKYKILGGRLQKNEDDDRERHEEEMRWIARAKEAEKEVSELIQGHQRFKVWAQEVGKFLKEALSPPYCWDAARGSHLFTWAVEEGIIQEPDCRPDKIIIPPNPEAFWCECSRSEIPYPDAPIQKGGTAVKVDGEERNFFRGMVTPEPDCGPGKIIIPPDTEAYWNLCQHSEKPYPGALIQKCSECGGYKIS